ncbi:PREDICTED: putative GTP-binding protein 6-like [Elephantulus edwardii]|uniref:putative GTP-binding protein 6-like n=1 Tax=Elephantulus edwardii TaxID=28737 RepID=UPI0003F0750E|nr:PREDICTED: putative GTP-binding protein 6-like [Elephantulus edwardii]
MGLPAVDGPDHVWASSPPGPQSPCVCEACWTAGRRLTLFATLDVTAHGGRLPSQLAVLYVDTIGFLSQLPHQLIASFSATLDDVAQADVVMHVRDVSHPDTELQKASVLSTLRGLQLPTPLLESMVEVHNKVDLVSGGEGLPFMQLDRDHMWMDSDHVNGQDPHVDGQGPHGCVSQAFRAPEIAQGPGPELLRSET